MCSTIGWLIVAGIALQGLLWLLWMLGKRRKQ